MRFSSEMEDPISILLKPPSDETLQQRESRLSEEAHAKRVSDQIDEVIKADKAALKKRKDAAKLLLLGQSESGKSTTLKNLQMTFAPKAWQAERTSWRAVIQLNLVRAVNTILDALTTEMTTAHASSRSSGIASGTPSSPVVGRSLQGHEEDGDDDKTIDSHRQTVDPLLPPHSLPFTHQHSMFKLSLSPLRSVETDLKTFLGSGSEEATASDNQFNMEGSMATPFDATSFISPTGPISPIPRRPQEFTVRSMSSWKSAVDSRAKSASPRAQTSALDSLTEVISGCKDDIHALWQDTVVKEILKRQRIKLQDSAVYYLDNVDRIAQSGYEPSDSDVLRARLRTLGVQEHLLTFENSSDFEYGKEWIIYDVGGSRTSRWAWLPYFDDAHAILFIAPISCFDEQLAEDHRVNRLQDSVTLWKSIVSSKLLANCAIILFLNKYDLLSRKIKQGAVLKDYVPTYGARENTAKEFSRYLRHQFKEQLRQLSPKPRSFYGFMTSVIDQKATAKTLLYMRDSILRDHLKKADFV